jgi:hypothetical protein
MKIFPVSPVGFAVLAIILLAGSCSSDVAPGGEVTSSPELRSLFQDDQNARLGDSDEPTGPADQRRRLRVCELLAEGAVRTAEDQFHAAMILNHTSLKFCGDDMVSASPENYYLGHCLAASSLEKGHEEARLLVAQTIDRYSYYTTGQQKYGTHRTIDFETGQEILAPVDSTVTDQERAKYGVPALADLQKMYGK